MAKDWQSITDEKEKYAAYLCSREWAKKKEAVRERAYGLCERCVAFKMDATHHLNYTRKYAEELEDLQAICNQCHQFTHGKSDFDPASCGMFIRYVEAVARDGEKRPVGYEFICNITSEIYDEAAVTAVMMMLGQYEQCLAVFNSHAMLGDFKDEHSTPVEVVADWLQCARLVQRELLSIDLIRWHFFRSPKCKSMDDYWTELRHFNFKPLNET